MIRRIAEKLKAGTKFFIRHGKTNSHEGRESVGEILTSYTKEIDGKLSTVAIGHFPKKEVVQEMDICSVEAEVRMQSEDSNVVGDVDDVSAIALESSDRDSPAFPGALRLASIQCFNEEPDKEEIKSVTFDEVLKAVKDMNIRPWQLFSLRDIQDDREFGKEFEKITTLEADNERLTKENETIKIESQESIKKSQVASANTRLDERMKEGFTDLQKSFIKKRFSPEKMEDVSDEALDSFLEEAKTDFAETAKLFGGTGDGGDETKPEKKPGGGNSEGATDEDLEKAFQELGVTDG